MPTEEATRPRVGCLGTGWIGRQRLEALVSADLVDVVALADADAAAAREAQRLVPHAERCASLEDLLGHDLDGAVIATPTSQHGDQTRQALEAGVAVCCQKPLARSFPEAEAVIAAARRADRLLMVDFSYRYTAAAVALREALARDAIGPLVGAELVFHNAYGPDKPWYRTRAEAGGGCVIDLGVHLLDLLTWLTGAEVTQVTASALSARGQRWTGGDGVEDFAQCQLALSNHATAFLTCSWWLHAGCDAVIGCTLYGARGGLRLRNIAGSFYDFAAERLEGTRQHPLTSPPDAWGGRAVVDWARRLVGGGHYDPVCEAHLGVSRALDAIYAAARVPRAGSAGEASGF